MTVLVRLLATLTLILAGSFPARAEERVTVFAAASLRGALEAVLDAHDSAISVSYGGSGTMARQVAQGAPADLVILANVTWMDWLEGQGMVLPETRRALLGNTLVVIAPASAPEAAPLDPADILARLGGGRLAVGQTRGVPAGIYARQWMERAGLWGDLSPHLAETENVRAALALVSRGEAPLGVVYASDALADPGVRVVHEIDPGLHDPIVYPVAVVTGQERASVSAVVERLLAPEASDIFSRHGFDRPGDGS